jgi:hypothetical protein
MTKIGNPQAHCKQVHRTSQSQRAPRLVPPLAEAINIKPNQEEDQVMEIKQLEDRRREIETALTEIVDTIREILPYRAISMD